VSFDHRRTAAGWHGGQESPLYALASTGTVLPGVDTEIWECLGLVERGELDVDLDPVAEHERLTALLHHVEPKLAEAKAHEVGAEHGRSAASWWQQDALGGRASGDTAGTAHWVLQGIEDGDPAILDTVVGVDQMPTAAEIAAEADWPEPDLDDHQAHERWDAAQVDICHAYAAAYVDAFWEAVAQACHNELGEPEAGRDGPEALIPETESSARHTIEDRHRLKARFLGAEVALTEASALVVTDAEAHAIVNGGRHPFDPPSLDGAPGSTSSLTGLTTEVLGAGAAGLTTEELTAAVGAMANAWEEGRDIVWPAALWSTAMRTLGHVDQARFLKTVAEGHLRSLASGLRYRPNTEPTEPYMRPVLAASTEDDIPPGWVAERAEPWAGREVEVVYDPRRFEVAFTSWSDATVATGAFKAVGWQQRAVDGERGFWVRDRVVAARATLARFEQTAPGVAHEASLPPASATRGFGL